MKSIELSGLQREHLLEMCNKLFPKYKRKNFNSWEFGEDDYGMIEFLMYEDNKKLKAIHWFELCMTSLIIKIRALTQKGYPDNIKEIASFYGFYWDMSNKLIHPIDYLYEQFLKIK